MDLVEILNYSVAFFTIFTTVFFLLLFFTYRHKYYAGPEWSGWTPMVSVVIPAYNEGKTIEKCLDSLLALDYPKEMLEIIVVDDGSTDDTYEKVKKYEKKGVRVIRQKNAGKGAALNTGIGAASGKLVATMDADSCVTPDVIKELLPYFEDDEGVMAVTPSVKIAPGGSVIKEFQRIEYLMILFSRKLLSYIDAVPVTPGPFSMFRKKIFDEIGGFDEHNLVEDQEIALRIQENHYRIRSSVSDKATVYTDPPDNMKDLLLQRKRWQRGGVRNYWRYRGMIAREFGDFGLFFIPLNFATLGAFFIVFGLLLNAIFNVPYYAHYIPLESVKMSVNMFTVVGIFVLAASLVWLYMAVASFRTERVKLRYLLFFVVFYWYMMMGANLLMAAAEIRREKCSW
jgi:cellulose synthase/poly-beta-1,6-N-acetylglucosamine synthase-like glycosyltransferase